MVGLTGKSSRTEYQWGISNCHVWLPEGMPWIYGNEQKKQSGDLMWNFAVPAFNPKKQEGSNQWISGNSTNEHGNMNKTRVFPKHFSGIAPRHFWCCNKGGSSPAGLSIGINIYFLQMEARIKNNNKYLVRIRPWHSGCWWLLRRSRILWWVY